MLTTGDILDKNYRIVKLLGRGGTGNVYLAENIKVGRQWAIKEINLSKAPRASLLAEVEILRKLDHKSLPRIVDLIELEDFIYIIEDYFEGTTLKEIITNRDICTEKNVLKWARQLCEILIYLHNIKPNAIIYRDMKPGNIIIDTECNAKLIDLGIAREHKADQDGDTVYIGTRGYAAPEQYSGSNQTDARTDVYGLGATLYHVITGLHPNAPPYQMSPIRCINNALSAELEAIISKCTQIDPNSRYHRVTELLNEIVNLEEKKYSNNKVDEQIKSSHFISTKLIVIGSLSFRAGSSFVASNLAVKLASDGISTAVIECPVNTPYLFDALFVREKTDTEFVSWAHELKKGKTPNRKEAFRDSGVTWVVVDPTQLQVNNWTSSDMVQLIYSVKQCQFIFVDVSTNWNHHSVSTILTQADHILLVVDPDPVLLDRSERVEYPFNSDEENHLPVESKTIKKITEMISDDHHNIDFIVNKYSNFINIDQLCLPLKPISLVPYFEPEQVYKSLWEGRLLYNNLNFKETFDHCFLPLVKRLADFNVSANKFQINNGVMELIKTAYVRLLGKKGEVR